ncbi:hypothetical protein ACWIID_30225 [Streptomyces phaeochromogenes]
MDRGVVRLTIDTETDSYEQAIAAVQAAYGCGPTLCISAATTSGEAGAIGCCSAWSRR